MIEFSGKSKVDYRYRVESTRAAGEADATPHSGTRVRCMREAADSGHGERWDRTIVIGEIGPS